MGKKDKKKGKGAEKTAAKTEKKLSARQRKELALAGEESIEKIVAQIENEEKKRLETNEIKISNPTRRAVFTFTAHPDKDEIILFGGEFDNGQKMVVYNDLIFYNINKNEWTLVKAAGAPPPRSGHQLVATSINKGQLWIFGGEFSNESQTQFYHYKDLWVYHISNKKWEKINSPGGPSPRSGHRMCLIKKQIVLFGGYQDNSREYKYFNDVYLFNLENYSWIKLEPSGTGPSQRSACQMIPLPDGKVLIYGGYSKEKVKKDVDKGTIHTDMFLLSPEKNDVTGLKWKWNQVKIGGAKLSPRCGATITCFNNKAYSFGGVFDVDEGEDDIAATFFNDLNVLDVEKRTWKPVVLTGKKDAKQQGNVEEHEAMEIESEIAAPEVISDDGVFKVTVGPAPVRQTSSELHPVDSDVFVPSPRMKCGLAVKRGVLYLYGGVVEDGDKQLTLCDFHSLDLHKLDEWKTIIKDEEAKRDWIGSDSSSDESEEDDSGDESGDEQESEEVDMDLA